jgi:integrase
MIFEILSKRPVDGFSRAPNWLIEAAPNRLYRMILVLLYATGVRRTEAARIRVEDIDGKRMVIHICQGKGARDRDVPLSPKLLEELRSYWQWKKPCGYLFPSTAGQRVLGDHPKPATCGHLKTGHSE